MLYSCNSMTLETRSNSLAFFLARDQSDPVKMKVVLLQSGDGLQVFGDTGWKLKCFLKLLQVIELVQLSIWHVSTCYVRGHFMSFCDALGRLAILKKLPEEQSGLGLELAHLVLWGQECEPPTFHIHELISWIFWVWWRKSSRGHCCRIHLHFTCGSKSQASLLRAATTVSLRGRVLDPLSELCAPWGCGTGPSSFWGWKLVCRYPFRRSRTASRPITCPSQWSDVPDHCCPAPHSHCRQG